MINEYADSKNWIEEAIYFVNECMHCGMSDEAIIERLHIFKYITDENLSLIMISGKLLYEDEIRAYDSMLETSNKC